MISKIFSAVLHGIEAELVTIETSISGGLPVTDIIGLADKTVNEAARRTRSAIISSGLNYPMGRVTVNIAPAGKRKRGSQLDLPMAIGVLASAGGIFMDELDGYCLAGELSLDGGVKKVTGLLPMLLEAKKKHLKMIIPYGNISEVMLIHGIDIYPVSSLVEVVGFFNKKVKLKRLEPVSMIDLKIPDGTRGRKLDYSDIRGMKAAKRALTIAAAGGHGVLMVGSPATGKTMLAERMPTIMPPMKYDEIIENTIIYSAAGLLTDDMPYVAERPFRNPHSSVTRAALIGGGLYPKPGEITLANRGVLFLDEFGEIDRGVIDSLRAPMENKEIRLVRNEEAFVFPADFILIAASNPCKCGYFGDPKHKCTCTDGEIARYRAKISGPVVDRIDIYMRLYSTPYEELQDKDRVSSGDMRAKVMKARYAQRLRYGNDFTLNSNADREIVSRFIRPNGECEELLKRAYESLKLDPRTYEKTKRIARTIADIDGFEDVNANCVLEALQYRPKESEEIWKE